MSTSTFSKNQLKLAEEHYKKGNLHAAIEIVTSLILDYPNTSNNHRKISQVLVAYKIHRRIRILNDRFTHYNVLRISRPFCSHGVIQRKYSDLVAKLCPEENESVAAVKSAFNIINTSWKVLSDPKTRRDYNIEKGFEKRIVHRSSCQRVSDMNHVLIFSDSD